MLTGRLARSSSRAKLYEKSFSPIPFHTLDHLHVVPACPSVVVRVTRYYIGFARMWTCDRRSCHNCMKRYWLLWMHRYKYTVTWSCSVWKNEEEFQCCLIHVITHNKLAAIAGSWATRKRTVGTCFCNVPWNLSSRFYGTYFFKQPWNNCKDKFQRIRPTPRVASTEMIGCFAWEETRPNLLSNKDSLCTSHGPNAWTDRLTFGA